MPNLLTKLTSKEFNILKKIQSLEEFRAFVVNEEYQNRKRKFKNQQIKLLNFNKNSINEGLTRDLFVLFNKIYSVNSTINQKNEIILKVLHIYSQRIIKEDILLFLTSFWHINGSSWPDFRFLFEIWLKFLQVDSIDISDKSIELIWFQDALLNISSIKKLQIFIFDLPTFIKLANFQYTLLSESIGLINKQPDHLKTKKEQKILFSDMVLESVLSAFCKYDNLQLEKAFVDLTYYLVDVSKIENVTTFTNIVRINLPKWVKKINSPEVRILYFLHLIWQKRLISFSHFLEFVFTIGNVTPRRKYNSYINFILNMYSSSFLQLPHILTLIDNPKLISFISKKNKIKLLEIFELNSDIFVDNKAIKFYIGLKKRLFYIFTNLNSYFDCIITNEVTWHAFIVYLTNLNATNKEKHLEFLLKYFNSPQYNVHFSTINEKYFDLINKVANILNFSNEDLNLFIFKKLFKFVSEDEMYSSQVPSLILLFFDNLREEKSKYIIGKAFLESLNSLNPLTMNANYYRMFLRDSYRIVLRSDVEESLVDNLTVRLDNFLESYTVYNDFLIPDKEKVEFLEYLSTFDLSIKTKEKITNWIKNKPDLNVRILTKVQNKENRTREYETYTPMLNTSIASKCGSCLRELTTEKDKRSCEQCEITLCLTCYIEFEFSGENCPGSIFGNKIHKFKIK